ncbi:peptidoglycan DD-metalloendopeptidase family protein [Shewanella sp. AS16]|uniref:peptidoglycan DD-metalloendopeptidase family protein n=1 Tax=Shewanella sp. AS16 TaxID=2907625 RepID=UPI001F21199C|nr:peptidoglycan DD-metalloendopeptidase family protein [Shewanella sp. AS16]MCE9685351.1 peptidoglycan DD-metalloendopeptidase family protein [Shewanella sp. AS16]
MGKVIRVFKLLPKKHQILLSILMVILTVTVLLPAEDAEASKQTRDQAIEINTRYPVPLAFRTPTPPSATEAKAAADTSALSQPLLQSQSQSQLQSQSQPEADSAQTIPDTAEAIELARHADVEHFEVKAGDTLAALFNRAGLSAREVYDITQLPLAKKNLLKIMPGEEIVIAKDAKGELTEVSYRVDAITTLLISKQNQQYQERMSVKKVEVRTQFASANIKSNFWNAAIDAGMTPNQVMQLATVFGWDIDFALDLRKGDNFALLYEQEYADGEFLRNGNILAAEFINQGERYTAVRYSDGNYYSESGNSMRKAFLRSPVDFKYVSSNFNPKRLHPVTGQVRAHRGVDYVAAIGTPIKAAGRGKVIASSYNQYNGNYVFIKHNDTYTTKYLHLSKRLVKRGQTVKQGQIIGKLGKTGRVTGAHLHYEFIVNGVHRNPRTISLPKAEAIDKREKQQFTALSQQLMATLQHDKQVQVAMQSASGPES